MAQHIEVTVRYTDGRAEVLPNPMRNDEVGRKVTEAQCWALLAREDVETAERHIIDRIAGGRRGTYR